MLCAPNLGLKGMAGWEVSVTCWCSARLCPTQTNALGSVAAILNGSVVTCGVVGQVLVSPEGLFDLACVGLIRRNWPAMNVFAACEGLCEPGVASALAATGRWQREERPTPMRRMALTEGQPRACAPGWI
jgi:hypothetical protein